MLKSENNMGKLIRNIFAEDVETTHNDSVNIHRLVKAGEIDAKIATYNYAWLEPQQTFETHAHPDGEEFFLILTGSGTLTVKQNGVKKASLYPLKSGDFVTIPKTTAHSIQNTSEEKLTFLTLRTISA